MLARLLLLVILAPVIVGAVIVAGVILSLQLAFLPAASAIAGCTQWSRDHRS
jgi:ABC-type Mn2+/Zn2+ transport system permease subunit